MAERGTDRIGETRDMKDDMVSRRAALDAVKRNTFRLTFAEEQNCEGHVAWSAEAVYSDVMESELLELPSAQPEIIRCKDCKWYGRANKRIFYRGMDCLQRRIDTIVPDKDFCSRAERRTNGVD